MEAGGAMWDGRSTMDRMRNIDVGLVYELWNEYAAAANDGDMARWITLWSEDGIQMPPGAPRRVGKEQIRREMQSLFDRFTTSNMVIHTEEIRILGDRAYSHGTLEYEITPKEGGETRSYSGKFLDILEKQVDGSWKIAIDCHNHNTPSA
jgi:uncharacterized protein (TIGR02246 family)